MNQHKRKDDWQPNLRSGNLVSLDSTDDDSDVPAVPAFPQADSSSAGGFGGRKRGESFSWLLNDSSQSRPSSPSALR